MANFTVPFAALADPLSHQASAGSITGLCS